jgi:anti-sigma factor (TIGR02949 family)
VNCTEAKEYLTAVLDGEVGGEKKNRFDEHIAVCPVCRTEFEVERITKGLIRGKLPSRKVPAHLRDSILQKLGTEKLNGRLAETGRHGLLGKLFAPPRWRPALALGMVLIIAVVGITLLTRRTPAPPPTEAFALDMVDEAVEHYNRYVGGGMKLHFVSSDAEEVRKFFQPKVHFEVYMPELDKAELIGGAVCEHGETSFLNLVYRMNDKILYFYMACSKEMKAKGKVGLSARAEQELNDSGWHFDTTHDNCNVAVWKEKDDVCSIVADMKKEELLALLKE